MNWLMWLIFIALLWGLFAWRVAVHIRKTINPAYSYRRRVAVLFDQALNVFVLFDSEDETISARCYRLQRRYRAWRWLRAFVDWLFRRREAEHCKASFEAEYNKLTLPPEYHGCEHTREGQDAL